MRFVGRESLEKKVPVFRNVNQYIRLHVEAILMDEVVKSARPEDYRIKSIAGIESMTFEDLENVPFLLGEQDVINSITLLPGVSTGGEGSTGFNVRGGKIDQNLITLNRAVIFNSSHLLGFFSIFNSDVVEDFSLYKGHLPANYGGRISSVLEVNLKEGNYQEWGGSGTFGIATSKIFAEGPIIENKLSIIGSARVAYPNWLIHGVRDFEVRNSNASFDDQNITLSYRFNDSNKVTYSFYRSFDKFQFGKEFKFQWQHLISSLTVQNALSENLIHEFEADVVNFENILEDKIEDFNIQSGVKLITLHDNFFYDGFKNHEIIAGAEWKNYLPRSEKRNPGLNSGVLEKSVKKDKGWILSGFAEDSWKIENGPTLSLGFRYNYYTQRGNRHVLEYEQGVAKSLLNVVDTTIIESGPVSSHSGFEPRIGVTYPLSDHFALKASYNRVFQYIHLISNTTTATPVDQWQVSTRYIKPQKSSNYSFGMTYQEPQHIWQFSVDLFHRDINRIYDYKDFANLILNNHLETELLQGKSRASGLEVLIEKSQPGWNGWLAYTYSKSENSIPGELFGESINNGEWYNSNYNQPNNVSLVVNRDIGKNKFFSFNFIYKTGRPFTGVESNFVTNNIVVPIYSERNKYRIPDYIRLDLAFGYTSVIRRLKDKFTFSIYNALGRDNAYSVFYRKAFDNSIVPFSYKLSVLGRSFPSITYSVNFVK